jgi:cytochrome c oxidase subunit II
MRTLATHASALALLLGLCACSSSAPVPAPAALVRVTAKRYQYEPARIVLKLGQPVVLELVSLDCHHGFAAPELGLRADILPGAAVRLPFLPGHAGTFGFHCDVFCGEGHEDMSGEIVVQD